MMTAKTASVTRNDLTTLLAKLETYIDMSDDEDFYPKMQPPGFIGDADC